MFIEQASSLAAEAAALEPWMLTDAELREATLAVHRSRAALDAVAVRLAGAVDDRGLAIDDGATSTTARLANVTGIVKAEAGKLVALSRCRGSWARGLRRRPRRGQPVISRPTRHR